MKMPDQTNPEWGSVKLGKSNLDIHHYGCTSCCLSYLSDYFKGYVSPPDIAKNVNNYTSEGLIVWEKLNFPTMKFERRLRVRPPDSYVQSVLKDPNKAIMFNVNKGAHWVVGIKKNLFGNDYTVGDPWKGVMCDVLKKYGDITGAAIFTRK